MPYPVPVPFQHFQGLIGKLSSREEITGEWVVNAVRECFGKSPESLTAAENDDLIHAFDGWRHPQAASIKSRFFLLLTPRVPSKKKKSRRRYFVPQRAF